MDFEQYCSTHVTWTYNFTEMDGKTPTYGGTLLKHNCQRHSHILNEFCLHRLF